MIILYLLLTTNVGISNLVVREVDLGLGISVVVHELD